MSIEIAREGAPPENGNRSPPVTPLSNWNPFAAANPTPNSRRVSREDTTGSWQLRSNQRSDARKNFELHSFDGGDRPIESPTEFHTIEISPMAAAPAPPPGAATAVEESVPARWVPSWLSWGGGRGAGAVPATPIAEESLDEGDGRGAQFAEDEEHMQRLTAQFHQEVSELKEVLKELRTDLLIVRQRHDAYISSADVREAEELRKDMKIEVARVSRSALEVKRRLDILHHSTEELAEDTRLASLFPASLRMRTAIVLQLRARLRDVMREFSELRGQIQQEHRDAVHRRLFMITGISPPDDEVDRVVESGEADNLFRAALMDAQVAGAEELLREERVRHLAFLDLERSLLELHQIYLDVATLVDAQGNDLDAIEEQVARATVYTVQGTRALRETKQLYRKSQKKKLLIGICCLGIVATAAAGITAGVLVN